jgi:hypothetical protein
MFKNECNIIKKEESNTDEARKLIHLIHELQMVEDSVAD